MLGLHAGLVPTLRVLVIPAQSLGQSRNRQVPRAPLPASGVTLGGEMSSISSEGVTPPSSLIRTHAPDQNPPYRLRLSLIRKVFAGCCQPLLEDGPSRRYLHNLCKGAWTHTPPRSWRSVRLDALALGSGRFDRRTSASPQSLTSSAREKLPAMQLQQGGVFRGCSHSLMFRLPYLLGPPVAPTAVTSTGQPGRLHHAMNMWLPALKRSRFYMNCEVKRLSPYFVLA